MKVLILHNAYREPGGEDAVVAAERRLLTEAGHDVHLATVSNEAIRTGRQKLSTLVRAPCDPARRDWTAALVSRTGAEIVHVHNFFPLLTPAVHAAAAQAGCAVVQTLHNYRLLCAGGTFLRDGEPCEKCLGGTRLWGVAHRCYRGSLPGSAAVAAMQWRAERMRTWQRDVHGFIALSAFARAKFIEGGLPADRISVKPNVAPENPAVAAAARRGVLFVGRLSREKGVAVLLEAARALPRTAVTIIGDGPDRAALEAMAPPNVRFAGRQPPEQVAAAMAAAACLVVPSLWYEGFPMVVAEAFAAGLPVVASDIGALAEIVGDGRHGLLFRAGDPADLSGKLSAALSSGVLPRLGERAGRTYRERLSPEANLRQLVLIYERAIERSRRVR